MSEQMENLSEKLPCAEHGQKVGQEVDINKKLILNMRDLNHIMRSLYEGKASQQRILIILNEVGNITQRDLTQRLGIQPGSASEILSKLENAGLIARTISETDRRTANISLTEQGRQKAMEAAEQRSRRHVEMFSCLSEKEKGDLLALLEKVNADWTQRYGSAAEAGRGKHHHHGQKCEGRCEGGHGHGRGGEEGHADGHGHRRGHGEEEGYGHGHRHEEEGHGHSHRHGEEEGHGYGHRHREENGHGHRQGHGEEEGHSYEYEHDGQYDHSRGYGDGAGQDNSSHVHHHGEWDVHEDGHNPASAQGEQFIETEEPDSGEVY